jgi:hypothetical protein
MKTNNFAFYILHIVLHSWFIRHWRTSGGLGKAPKCGKNLFMQNEPNFTMHLSRLSTVIAGAYNERTLPDMKITNPIRTQLEDGQKSTPTSVMTGTYNEKPTLHPKITNPIEPKRLKYLSLSTYTLTVRSGKGTQPSIIRKAGGQKIPIKSLDRAGSALYNTYSYEYILLSVYSKELQWLLSS